MAQGMGISMRLELTSTLNINEYVLCSRFTSINGLSLRGRELPFTDAKIKRFSHR